MENELNLDIEKRNLESVENYEFEPIKGYPMLRWKGKRPFTSTQYYPAKLKETFGEDTDGWLNKLFWGDNLQVMSHLLKEYRGKIRLIYIDPPFDSIADYKMTIELRGKKAKSDNSNFEEKQYGDIWSNDEYLQFMYERLILMKELLSDDGTIYVHCDYHKNQYIRIILDEIFGADLFLNEVIWCYGSMCKSKNNWNRKHDTILVYTKSRQWVFNAEDVLDGYDEGYREKFKYKDENGYYMIRGKGGSESPIHSQGDLTPEHEKLYPNWTYRQYLKEGGYPKDWWDIPFINSQAAERLDYPTQKPEALIERVVKASSNPGDIVFDCFMGSGTTQAVAMKLGRRFIGADINLGAIEITTKRLLNIQKELQETIDTDETPKYLGFEVYNVNNYDVFRNPIQAKELLVQALELQPLPQNSLYDGEKDGRMWKILPINRLANRADLTELINGFDYKHFAELQSKTPNKPVEKITLVCMGHEPDLAGFLVLEMKKAGFIIDVEVLDILRQREDLQFRRDSEAEITIEAGKLVIREFFPMNLLSKLSWEKQSVDDWRVLVDSIKIDFNYDGAVFSPTLIDIPEKNQTVKGIYTIPADAGTIRVKITDVLSESLEMSIENN